MNKVNNNKRQEELVKQKEWSLTILNFISRRQPDATFVDQMKTVVIDTFESGNARGLRYCYRDINEMAKGLNGSDGAELDSLLKAKFDEDLNHQNSENKEIQKILKKGVISGEDEYRLLLGYADEIYRLDEKKDDLEKVNKILASFHKS